MSEKIWLKNYPKGVPTEINPQEHSSLVELFEFSCGQFANKTAITNMGVSLTYGQLERLSRDFAAYLQNKCQLKKGDRVAIMLPNVLQYYVSLFGILRAGLVVVNVNPLYTPRELLTELADAEVECIVIMANFAHTLTEVQAKLNIPHIIVTELGDLFGFPKANLVNFVVRSIKKMVPAFHFDQFVRFNAALHEGTSLPLDKVEIVLSDMAFLQYTGGTTGTPKGAVLSHGNMVANVEQALAWIKGDNFLKKGVEIVLAPLPLYHIFSLTVCAFCFLKLGGRVCLVTNPRDINAFVKEMQKIPFTVLVGINTLFNAFLHNDNFTKAKFPTLKLVIGGGAPVQTSVAEAWKDKTGITIIEGYGVTEASPIITVNPIQQKEFKDSIGLPLPSTDVVVRNNGEDLPPGEEGELCVKGPQVMSHYWHNEEETRGVFTEDGWLRTGDIARYDEQGYFYIVERKKDMVLVSGFNVYPTEIEGVLSRMPGIAEVAVIGVPNSLTGEAVKAFVVKSDPKLTAQDVINFSKRELTGYKIPKDVEFVDSLPKSNVGKVLRRELRLKDNNEQ